MEIIFRKLREDEAELLKDFLYEAIYIPEGVTPPDRSITELPELAVYYEDFGNGPADHCIVAEDDGRVVGAVWSRLMHDYGHVDDETPSLAISLYKEYREKGIGTVLMKKMLELLKETGYQKVSLAVQKANYAVRMYQAAGFKTVKESEEEYIMVCELNKKKLFSEIPVLQGERILLRGLTDTDAPGLQKLVDSTRVYKYLPTFLFEKKYPDVHDVIARLYDECLQESLILGVFLNDEFCGLAEMYGYKDSIHKVSVGYRLHEEYWGRGIATETLGMLIQYLYGETDIEIITASTMVENIASANVLKKNEFMLVSSGVGEDWGYEQPTIADKWIR